MTVDQHGSADTVLPARGVSEVNLGHDSRPAGPLELDDFMPISALWSAPELPGPNGRGVKLQPPDPRWLRQRSPLTLMAAGRWQKLGEGVIDSARPRSSPAINSSTSTMVAQAVTVAADLPNQARDETWQDLATTPTRKGLPVTHLSASRDVSESTVGTEECIAAWAHDQRLYATASTNARIDMKEPRRPTASFSHAAPYAVDQTDAAPEQVRQPGVQADGHRRRRRQESYLATKSRSQTTTASHGSSPTTVLTSLASDLPYRRQRLKIKVPSVVGSSHDVDSKFVASRHPAQLPVSPEDDDTMTQTIKSDGLTTDGSSQANHTSNQFPALVDDAAVFSDPKMLSIPVDAKKTLGTAGQLADDQVDDGQPSAQSPPMTRSSHGCSRIHLETSLTSVLDVASKKNQDSAASSQVQLPPSPHEPRASPSPQVHLLPPGQHGISSVSAPELIPPVPPRSAGRTEPRARWSQSGRLVTRSGDPGAATA